MSRAVILAAGRSSRLAGANKLLVEAGSRAVHEWHQELLAHHEVTAVVQPSDFHEVADAATWISTLVGHADLDGPVGALLAYLRVDRRREPLTVLFADTLLRDMPEPEHADWVGVARAPGRAWDYYDQGWGRGQLPVPVCVGLYHFSCSACVENIARVLVADRGRAEVPMVELLSRYETEHPLELVRTPDWQDAGDPTAIAAVEP